jgi:hypothetical protein
LLDRCIVSFLEVALLKERREEDGRRERMMGLEPTTFCMASRRSSQLSYIREAQAV